MTSSVSRRSALGGAAKFLLLAGATLTPAQAKVAQANAGYQDAPKGELKCASCVHFAPPSSCQIVDGTISPNGWCKLFAPKGE